MKNYLHVTVAGMQEPETREEEQSWDVRKQEGPLNRSKRLGMIDVHSREIINGK